MRCANVRLLQFLLTFLSCCERPVLTGVARCSPTVVLSADGFGEEGRGSEVPPGASLEIELELLGWKRVEKVTRERRESGGSSLSLFAS